MFKNAKIGKKLLISFIAITIISGSSGVAGLIWLSSSNSAHEKVLVENGFVQGDIGHFNAALYEDGGIVRDIVFLKGIFKITESRRELDEVRLTIDQDFEKIKASCSTPEELEAVKIIEQSLPAYREESLKVIDLGRADKDDEAMEIFRDTVSPYLVACTTAASDLLKINTEEGNRQSKLLEEQARFANLVVGGLIGVAVLFAIAITILMSKAIAKPIKICAKRLVGLAEGDFHTPVARATSNDETGVMLKALRNAVDSINGVIGNASVNLDEISKGNLSENITGEYMGDLNPLKESMIKIQFSLSEAIKQINNTANHVSATSEQVAQSAQALAHGASEQSASIQELSAAMSEMTEKIKENAKSAGSAHDISIASGEAIIQGNEQMNKMTNAMQEITQSSKEIEKIIATIEGIAFQTNILALNAAVEAARAGQAGKGFSVVANEVRSLSGKSSDAAKNSTGLIVSSVDAVERGRGIALKTAQSLDQIVKSAEKTTGLVEKIAVASKIQAETAQNITFGIEQISTIVQNNSATAQQSSAASAELSSQAQLLKELVSNFKLKESAKNLVESDNQIA